MQEQATSVSLVILDRVIGIIRGALADRAIGAETPLVSSELLDSVSVVNIVLDLESAFLISIPETMVVPENFETAAAISRTCDSLITA